MKITLECECRRKHTVSAPEKKYLQFRDDLEAGGFRFSSSDIKIRDGRAEELIIHCDCGNYISLGLD